MTHNVRFLPEVDQIVVLTDGAVSEVRAGVYMLSLLSVLFHILFLFRLGLTKS